MQVNILDMSTISGVVIIQSHGRKKLWKEALQLLHAAWREICGGCLGKAKGKA